MRTPPSTAYSGLTFIIDEPSRFDAEFNRLLSGPAREYLNTECLPPRYHLDSCDIRDIECSLDLLPNTTHVIIAGNKAAEHLKISCDPPGYLTSYRNIPAIPIFYIQDGLDYKMMRGGAIDFDDEELTDRDTKEKTPTRRKSFRFWNKWHIRKFLDFKLPIYPPPDLQIYPDLRLAINVLNRVGPGEDLFLDIETSRVHRSINCLGFSSFSSFPSVYVVPFYRTNCQLAYPENLFYAFYKALSLAISRANVVIHNSMFDLTVLHGFYKFCLPASVYDTMAAQYRCFPEVEKSLAHTISCWTWLANHKDFDTEIYDGAGEANLWKYNGLDVYAMKPIKDGQLAYARHVPGLEASIAQVNASIIPYLATSLIGMRLDTLRLSHVQAMLLKKKRLYERMCSILVGKTFNPGSAQQCAAYFHRTLNYPVVEKTSTGREGMGSSILYQLQLKHENPLIPVIIKYREAAKDASMLESELFTLP